VHAFVFVNHYSILNVPRDASADVIKSAYRTLAKIHHPDKFTGDAYKFSELSTSYRTLIDPNTRSRFDEQYDRYFRSLILDQSIQIGKSQQSEAHTNGFSSQLEISPSRFIYPSSVANLAKKGYMRKRFRTGDRRLHIKLEYDLELPLSDNELNQPLSIRVPLTARTLCPDCMGSDQNCYACDGMGYHMSSRTLRVEVLGGLAFNQVLEIQLSGIKPEPLSHFKKSKLRIKISKSFIKREETLV
jgi:DnaJ-class molecular chaperone